jgi:signal transduction histidine kinase/ActR/RegA family two-component response regulator
VTGPAAPPGSISERALVLAPSGRDATVACRLLEEAAIAALPVPDLPALMRALAEGAGLLVVTDEALRNAAITPLAAWFAAQPPWSDLAVLLLTARGGGPERNPAMARISTLLGNVSFVERPFHPATLVGAARSALRGRRRQYEARARLEQIEAAQSALRSANDRLERAVAERTRELQEANAQIRAEMAERLQAEDALRQAQRLEAMGQLTGGVAHDFNNLLMVLSAGLDVLARQHDPQRRERVMEGMRQAVGRGASLTRQLLTFARRQPLSPRPLDLATQLPFLKEMLAASLQGDIRIVLELPPGLWLVEVDPNEMELALLNLALNARDAMPEGGQLTLSARNHVMREGEFVALRMADTGSGISPEVLQRVFEPFFTTKETGKGSGLGLAQVHGFAQSSGGQVRIESRLGGGTVVEMLLPRTLAQPLPSPLPAKPAGLKGEPLHVLIVEDSDAVASVLEEMVAQLGHRTTRVASARAALDAIEEASPPDLVLSDVMMPGGMSGIELAQEIRRRHHGLPVVLASGRADAALLAARRAAVPLLGKPFEMRELASAIAEARARPAGTAPEYRT